MFSQKGLCRPHSMLRSCCGASTSTCTASTVYLSAVAAYRSYQNRTPLPFSGRQSSTRCNFTTNGSAVGSSAGIPSNVSNIRFQLLADFADADILVKLQNVPLGYGLAALEPVARDSVIDIPVHNLLIVSDVNTNYYSNYLNTWQAYHGPLPDVLLNFITSEEQTMLRLMALLIWVRDNGSALWQEYTQLLPSGEELTCLMCYSREEAEELQVQPMQTEADEQRGWVKEAHWRLWHPQKGALKDLGMKPSFNDTLWAAGILKTRSVELGVGGCDVMMLTPVADFANHSFEPSCEYTLNEEGTRFEVIPCRPLPKDEEVTVAYTPVATNYDLMRDFGFVVAANPFEVIELPAAGDGIKELDGRLLRAALNLEGSFKEHTLKLGGALKRSNEEKEEGPEEEMSDMDWFRMRSALMSLPVADFGGVVMQPDAFSRQELLKQKESAESLKTSVSSALEAMPTSATTDEKLLLNSGSMKLSPRQRQAILSRLEYKYLFKTAVDVLERYFEFLSKHSA